MPRLLFHELIEIQQKLVRALVAAQVAVFEWGECDIGIDDGTNAKIALAALDTCLKEATRLAKKLRDE